MPHYKRACGMGDTVGAMCGKRNTHVLYLGVVVSYSVPLAPAGVVTWSVLVHSGQWQQ